MAKRHRKILAELDPIGLKRYQITEKEVQIVEKYLSRTMMKLRRLQRQDANDEWYDDAYAYEDSQGRVIFRYNLTWDRVGSAYNGKLQESGVSIEAIKTVLQPSRGCSPHSGRAR